MSFWRTSWSAVLQTVGMFACGVGAGCDGHRIGEPELGPLNDGSGQTGSPESGGYECKRDADCAATANARAAELNRPSTFVRSFESARCEHTSLIAGDSSRSGPACACDTGQGGHITVGPSGGECQVRGRAGSCLWERFEGCDVFDAHSCDAVCTQLEQRYAEDAARTFDAHVEYFDCARDTCRSVISIDGACVPDSAIGSGRRYDCALGGEAILKQEAARESGQSQEPSASAAWERPAAYVAGTRGTLELGVHAEAWGGAPSEPLPFAWVQFAETPIDGSFHGDVLDPLSGIDDCGVIRHGMWSGASPSRFLQIGEAALQIDDQRFVFEPWPNNNRDFFSYGAPEAFAKAPPRYGSTYTFSAKGGDLPTGLSVPVRLPEALQVSSLGSVTRVPKDALSLRWSGRGAGPLRLVLSVLPRLADVNDSVELECLMKDDGEFTLPADVLAKVPDGSATARFTRESRSVEKSGAEQLLVRGKVEITYHLAFGQHCERQDVLEACKRYAQHEANIFQRCGKVPAQPVERTCPAYLAESCGGCVEYFECRAKALDCGPLGPTTSTPCSCP